MPFCCKALNRSAYKALMLVCGCFPAVGFSSPWLEANDPFLRSSLVLLSDSNQISSPVNIYPQRWSLFGDDLTDSNEGLISSSVFIAKQEVLYALNTARLNRGNNRFKVIGAIDQSSLSSFGQFNEDEMGAYISTDYLSNAFSYRLTAAYSEYNDEKELNWNDSYLSLNASEWLFTLGNVNRWWGQGWQHNLILASYAKAAPDVSASYIGANDFLGVWSVESLLSKPVDSAYDNHSATRLVSKPFSIFEYGMTYQTWFSDVNNSGGNSDSQIALDAKLVLPHIKNLYHSVYLEMASTSTLSELGAWMMGWTGGFNIADHNARIVLESQQTTSAHDSTSWSSGDYPSSSDGVTNNSYLLDDSYSAAFYLQLKNDHNLGLIYRNSTEDGENIKSNQVTYRLPALNGMMHFGVGHESSNTDGENFIAWSGYELRF
ncbi:hypothetical protein MUS1_03000 [Marinomonas ushuaiensis DSM 15871]|uniref:Capsule assembly Wzi family protein n=2 Tax=Marinomonas TaxID=28253 RepID=X7EC53_9GAMM|nr:hypothetical protein MUS1_03000 [Marinomonas ushuaiensis DSM 15871]